MCGSMVDIQSATAEIRRGKKEERKNKKPQGKNIMSASATQDGHNKILLWPYQGMGRHVPSSQKHNSKPNLDSTFPDFSLSCLCSLTKALLEVANLFLFRSLIDTWTIWYDTIYDTILDIITYISLRLKRWQVVSSFYQSAIWHYRRKFVTIWPARKELDLRSHMLTCKIEALTPLFISKCTCNLQLNNALEKGKLWHVEGHGFLPPPVNSPVWH